jgi:hypothetical protein
MRDPLITQETPSHPAIPADFSGRRPYNAGVKRWLPAMLVGAASLAIGTTEAMLPPPIMNTPPPEAMAPRIKSPLGTNLSMVADWSTQQPFRDFFKMSREWISGEQWVWSNGKTVKTDANGWVASLEPGQVARTIFMTGPIAPLFAGTYSVTWEGEGSMQYDGAVKLITGQSKPGLDMVEVTKTGENFVLAITQTNPSNPIRNIKVQPAGLPPSSEAIQFNPDFLDRMRPYSTIRFMDWMRTNDAAPASWETRAKPSDAMWTTAKGVPLEAMASLCNQIKADPWFTMSHLWDDQYIVNFAKLADEQLDPSLTIYVEHSNEVWNGMFQQATYAREQGMAMGLATEPFLAQLRYHSQRSVEIFKLFQKSVKPTRKLARVMGGWHCNTWSSGELLGWKSADQFTDALAIAPYFGYEYGLPENAAKVDQMSVRDLVRDIRRRAIPDAMGFCKDQKVVCDQHGVALIAYEAGQHLVGVGPRMDSEPLNKLFDAINRDLRMQSLYLRYFNSWRDLGGGLMMNFTDCGQISKWGRWGSMEWIDQDPKTAPKYNAVLQFAGSNQRWWPDVGKPAGQLVGGK